MKKLFLYVVIAVCLLISAKTIFNKVSAYQKNQILTASKNSFEYGCYFEAQNLCSTIRNDERRGACYDDALNKCPDASEKFKEWLEGK